MKKLLFAIVVLFFALSFSACKKCFHCYNACKHCTIVINSHTFSNTYCVDSFSSQQAFDAAVTADSALGYVCSASTPSYSYDFCSNQAGESTYPNYFNKGKRATCDEK